MKLFKVERFERFENCYDTQDTVAGQINVRDIFKNVTQHLHLEMHYTRRKYLLKKSLLFTTHFITAIYLAHVIEQPNLRIPNPQYLQLNFCFDFF